MNEAILKQIDQAVNQARTAMPLVRRGALPVSLLTNERTVSMVRKLVTKRERQMNICDACHKPTRRTTYFAHIWGRGGASLGFSILHVKCEKEAIALGVLDRDGAIYDHPAFKTHDVMELMKRARRRKLAIKKRDGMFLSKTTHGWKDTRG